MFLKVDVYISRVVERVRILQGITIRTSQGATYGPYGQTTDMMFTTSGSKLVGVTGRAGIVVNQVNMVWAHCEEYGRLT